MKNLFEATVVDEVKERIGRLRPDSERQWGKMNAAQAVEHCSRGMELALGDRRVPRMLIGRILGPMVKAKAFAEGAPLRKNSPTLKGLAVTGERDLVKERERLSGELDEKRAPQPVADAVSALMNLGYAQPLAVAGAAFPAPKTTGPNSRRGPCANTFLCLAPVAERDVIAKGTLTALSSALLLADANRTFAISPLPSNSGPADEPALCLKEKFPSTVPAAIRSSGRFFLAR